MPGEGEEEVLDLGPRSPLSRAVAAVLSLPGLVALGGVAGLVLVLVLATSGGDPSAKSDRTAAPSVPASVSSAPGPPAAQPFGDQHTRAGRALQFVYGRAHDATTAHDFIRSIVQSGCRDLPPGAVPERTILRVIAAALPGFSRLDSRRAIDQTAALCSVEIRARDDAGTVLVLSLVPPGDRGAPFIGSGAVAVNNSYTVAAWSRSRDGWGVTVGASGPYQDRVARDVLTRLAGNPALRW